MRLEKTFPNDCFPKFVYGVALVAGGGWLLVRVGARGYRRLRK
jgi:hypothetical protein